MRYNRNFLFFLFALVFLLACTSVSQQIMDTEISQKIAEKGRNSTVLLVSMGTDHNIQTGSGFFITPNWIVTNIHVVAGVTNVFAIGVDTVHNIESVTGYYAEHDLVILKVSGKGKPLPIGKAQIGESVIAIGYPGGGFEMTEGTIHTVWNKGKQLRLKAKLVSGNSGGPVLNNKGEVVGVATSGYTLDDNNTSDFGYASSSKAIMALLKHAEKDIHLSQWQNGRRVRAYAYENWASKKIESHDYDEAIVGLDKAIELYPNFAVAYMRRGRAKAFSGLYNEAIKDFDEVIKRNPEYDQVYGNNGLTKYLRRQDRDYQAATEDFKRAINLNGDLAPAYLGLGNVKRKSGDPKGAIEAYSKAINKAPKYAEAYLQLGTTKYITSDYVGAIEAYNTAINHLKPAEADADVYLNLGNAKWKSSDAEGALEAYNKAIDLKPDFVKAYSQRLNLVKTLLDLKVVQENPKVKKSLSERAVSDKAAIFYHQGKIDFNSKKYNIAIENFSTVIRLNPDFADAYYNRALAKAELNDYDSAIEDYTRATERKSDFTDAYYNRGNAYRLRGKEGDYQAAIKDYIEAIRLNPDFADAYYNRALTNDALGQDKTAKRDFATAYYYSGIADYKRQKYQAAIKNFNKVIELNSKSANVYNYRGLAKQSLAHLKAQLRDLDGAQRFYEEALKDFDTLIRLNPEHHLAYYQNSGWTKYQLGVDLSDDGSYKAAIEDFTEVIKQNPDYAEAHNRRGLSRYMLGCTKVNHGNSKEAKHHYNLALEDFKKANKLDFDNASYYGCLGLANAALGKAKVAIEAFKKCKNLRNFEDN